MKHQPKDYETPMGHSSQHLYSFRVAFVLAVVAAVLWWIIKFAAMTLEAMGKMT